LELGFYAYDTRLPISPLALNGLGDDLPCLVRFGRLIWIAREEGLAWFGTHLVLISAR